MKKILSALLLIFAMLLSACGGVKYELNDGVMYADGKEANGTFEFKTGKYKVKGNYINGLPDGLFEEYYEDGSIMAKETFVNGEMTSKELYYNRCRKPHCSVSLHPARYGKSRYPYQK